MTPHLSALHGHGHRLQIIQEGESFTLLAAHVATRVGPAVLLLDAAPASIATLLNVDDVALHLRCEGRAWVQLLDLLHHDAGLVNLEGGLRLWRGREHADLPHVPDALHDLLRSALAQPPQPLDVVLRQVGTAGGLARGGALDERRERRADFWAY